MRILIDIGTRLSGGWTITGLLGEGGAGQVFRARGLENQEVAIKILLQVQEQQDTLRFIRERFILERIPDHTHIIKLLDTGTFEDCPFIVMELASGSLDRYLDRQGTIDEKEACWILAMAVSGLRSAGTVHRDMKPANLLIMNPGNGITNFIPGDIKNASIVKVADFGLAKDRDPAAKLLTKDNKVMGTPAYMSPEQWRNSHDVTIESDIYAIGIILYQMITGQVPFDDYDPGKVGAMHQRNLIMIPQTVSPQVRSIIACCTAKDPGDRYRTLMGLEEALLACCGKGITIPKIKDQTVKPSDSGLMKRLTSIWKRD